MNMSNDKIDRFYNENERLLLRNAHRRLFKERLKIALDQRVGTNFKYKNCTPKYHANVMDIHRTTMLRYLNPKSEVVPSFDMLVTLIEYIKHYLPNFNPAFLFDDDAPMVK